MINFSMVTAAAQWPVHELISVTVACRLAPSIKDLSKSVLSIHPRSQRPSAWSSRPQIRQLRSRTDLTVSGDLPTRSQGFDLPVACPGCGAFVQFVSADQPGFYSTNRKSMELFLHNHGQVLSQAQQSEAELFDNVLKGANLSLLSQMDLGWSDSIQGTYYLVAQRRFLINT